MTQDVNALEYRSIDEVFRAVERDEITPEEGVDALEKLRNERHSWIERILWP